MEYWRRLHWTYIAQVLQWTIWDFIGAEACARANAACRGEEEPTDSGRAICIGIWIAFKEQDAK